MHADLNAVPLIANPSRVLREISATAVAIIDTFVTVALFSGIGLLLSLSVLILELSAWRGLSQTPKFSERFLNMAKAYRSLADVLKAKKKSGKKRRLTATIPVR